MPDHDPNSELTRERQRQFYGEADRAVDRQDEREVEQATNRASAAPELHVEELEERIAPFKSETFPL